MDGEADKSFSSQWQYFRVLCRYVLGCSFLITTLWLWYYQFYFKMKKLMFLDALLSWSYHLLSWPHTAFVDGLSNYAPSKEGDGKPGTLLVIGLNESAVWPCFSIFGCVHHPLLLLSRFCDGSALTGVAALVVARSSLSARVQLITQMMEGKSRMNGNSCGESPPPSLISYQADKDPNSNCSFTCWPILS